MSPPDAPPQAADLTHWIECDTYDRQAFARLKDQSASLQTMAASGARLLPHFDGFLQDLFSLFFKMNVVFHSEETVAPSASLFRFLLEQIRATPALDIVRQQTALDEGTAGLATLLLGEAVLDLLRSERVLTRGEMLDVWNLERQEEELKTTIAQAETAEELSQATNKPSVQRQLRELQRRMKREADAAQRRLHQQATRIRQSFAESAKRQQGHITAQVDATLEALDTSRDETNRWSAHLGGGMRSSPAAQIELGHRLARNPKLKRMAQLVGRMKENARALRRQTYERSSAEMFTVEAGAELSRLLPHELLGLRHPSLRLDFARRLVERELLLYGLRAREEKGRGPMIVCLDGSSSMAGEKEIWSKAVTLTLLDIASRQRRRFRSICFSSADTPLQILDLNPGGPYAAEMQRVFELAEYFPGGGTDFRTPLAAALECLGRDRMRRGDIVFITDGECRIEAEWLAEFRREKERLGFSLISVLIDVGPSSLGALREFSDRITSVTQLTTEATRDIFLEI